MYLLVFFAFAHVPANALVSVPKSHVCRLLQMEDGDTIIVSNISKWQVENF